LLNWIIIILLFLSLYGELSFNTYFLGGVLGEGREWIWQVGGSKIGGGQEKYGRYFIIFLKEN
jgi:hypothetical protein